MNIVVHKSLATKELIREPLIVEIFTKLVKKTKSKKIVHIRDIRTGGAMMHMCSDA